MNKSSWRDRLKIRTVICALVISCMMMLLMLRLWQVQIMQGPEHLRATQRQSYRPIRLNPVRGRIFSADHKLLVDNATAYDLVFHMTEMRRPGVRARTIEHILDTEKILAFMLQRQSMLTEQKVKEHIRLYPVMPLHVFKNLTPEELAVISEISPPLDGVDILPRIERVYPYPGMASHILGMTSWAKPDGTDMLEELPHVYVTPQLKGRDGLEAEYDKVLAGTPGSRIVMVDAVGYDRRTVLDIDYPRNGCNLILTIDANAQAAAERVLEGNAGALVAVNVKTGAVLAAASAPTYSLAALTAKSYGQMAQDNEGRPLFNRAFNGTYTPGSIVKPLMALALLENGVITEDDCYECTGRLKLGSTVIRCAKTYGHGPIDLVEAIEYSCNPFFMHFGMEMGIDAWQPLLTAAGFGTKSGVDWPEIRSSAGIRPCRDFAQRVWKRNWIASDMAYASIGQGAFTVTPLQVAMYAAALANGGALLRPYLVQEISDENGNLLSYTAPVIRSRLPVSEESLAIVRQGMVGAVEEKEGSAHGLAEVEMPLAAKTGTAEVGSGENRHKNTWVIAYGPAEEPEYAVACIIERGTSGGKTVVPIVAQFFKQWLETN